MEEEGVALAMGMYVMMVILPDRRQFEGFYCPFFGIEYSSPPNIQWRFALYVLVNTR
jgi:hypothetical protein